MNDQQRGGVRIDDLEFVLHRPDTWTTVYIDGPAGEPPGTVEQRMDALERRLEDAGAPEADRRVIASALGTDGDTPAFPSSRWLAVRDGRVEAAASFTGARLGPERVVQGAFPEVAPLLRHLSTERRILIIETERAGARLSTEQVGRADRRTAEVVDGETAQITKVQAGGWSHAGYQRHAEEVWRRNQSEVADAANQLIEERRPDRIFVTGDVRARTMLIGDLHVTDPERIVEVDADTLAAGSDDTALDRAIDESVADAGRQLIVDARDRSAAGGGRDGATGVAEVVEALQQGRVEVMVLDPRMTESGTELIALTSEPWIALSSAEDFDVEGTRVASTEALARAAIMTGARVLFDEEDLADAEERPDRTAAPPIAVLRWPRTDQEVAARAQQGHPSQAEGEDPEEEHGRDPDTEGHPSQAEGEDPDDR
ncbi:MULTISPECIES: Vms1/Ankzf1 family peptidyl-tRNA hydrolase [unclassified Microbacterium]|uniref:baeRF2 domain-containing protein n=1 Tax=unclassified Microbacterium TaxID=2609290 RepID=UPI0012F99284|nr:Vms1/Ankzf1 family peptidyl-tRNA hydrolase [Microbacterium sp. MAH-37]MVQ43969.1 hypothetical protein [Microbacterium sp. MAH-37]